MQSVAGYVGLWYESRAVSFRPILRYSPLNRFPWFWRPAYGALVTSIVVCALLACAARWGVFASAELEAFDLLVRLRGPEQVHWEGSDEIRRQGSERAIDQLVIVDFDDATVNSLGAFPIPRSVLADVLEKISAGRPDLVGLDLLLSERRAPEEDRRLEAVLRKNQNFVLAGIFETDRISRNEPLPEFRDAALAVGFVNLPLDQDGVVRRMFLSLSWPGFNGSSFPLALAMNHLGRPIEEIRAGTYRLGPARVYVADAATNTALLGEWGLPPAGRILPARRLLAGEYEPSWFEQKIVLVGQSSAAGKDLYATPLFRSRERGGRPTLLSGVELHALALANLLGGQTIRVPAARTLWVLNFLLIGVVCAGVILFRPIGSVPATIVLGLGLFVLATHLFSHNHIWLKFVSAETGVLLALTGGLGYRFVSEQRHTAAFERELALARGIQQALLPERLPQIEGLDIAARYESSSEVGGDYYDFIRLGDSQLLFVVADVQGHGVASALIMSNFQATLRALIGVQGADSPAGLISALDNCLVSSTRGKRFVTVFLGVLNLASLELCYVNAGHVVPIVLRSAGGTLELSEGGAVIGLGGELFSALKFETGLVQLRRGDLLVAVTDGITEAANADGEEYRTAGITRVAVRLRGQPSQRIVDAVFEDVAQFSRGGSRQDDKVLIAIQVDEAGRP